jgi:predicted pyridoxine 5'-phosphate oxidase superfamily flavin-nucleotide-binding protein
MAGSWKVSSAYTRNTRGLQRRFPEVDGKEVCGTVAGQSSMSILAGSGNVVHRWFVGAGGCEQTQVTAAALMGMTLDEASSTSRNTLRAVGDRDRRINLLGVNLSLRESMGK